MPAFGKILERFLSIFKISGQFLSLPLYQEFNTRNRELGRPWGKVSLTEMLGTK